jgi:hypothetical protein
MHGPIWPLNLFRSLHFECPDLLLSILLSLRPHFSRTFFLILYSPSALLCLSNRLWSSSHQSTYFMHQTHVMESPFTFFFPNSLSSAKLRRNSVSRSCWPCIIFTNISRDDESLPISVRGDGTRDTRTDNSSLRSRVKRDSR